MNKKSFFIIIGIFLVVLIALVIPLKLKLKQRDQEQQIEQELEDREAYSKKMTEEFFSDKICPKGLASLYTEYQGENDRIDLYEGLYDLVGYINKMYPTVKDYDNSELEEYYNNNFYQIYENIKIKSFEEFLEFVSYLRKVGLEETDKYKFCEIDTETFENSKDYLMFEMSFYYEGKDKLINLKTYFANKIYVTPELKFEPLTD